MIEPADNACSEARVTTRLRHRPGASPLLFGRFLMSLGAFVSLEDISDALPPYREEVVSVEMDQPLKTAYEDLQQDIKKALREHRGNQSVASVALNALPAYPDRPFGLGDLIGREFNPETQRREPFLIAATRYLDEDFVYAKERRLVEEIKSSLERGRKVRVYAVYAQKRDVTRRLVKILAKEGIRVAVLTTEIAPEQRESWYERQLRAFRWSSGTPVSFKPDLICGPSRTSSSMRRAIPSTPCDRPAGALRGLVSGRTSTSSSSTTPGPCRKRV